MTTTVDRPPVGVMIREWRLRRRCSQLDVSSATGVSSRHLSFVETGRARPSSTLILRLSDHLDVPLRERNRMLLAGGYAPRFTEHELDAPAMRPALDAVREVLRAHEPVPALAVDRLWNIVDANSAVSLFTEGCSPMLLEPPINALRLTLHPDGMAPRIVNLPEWRAAVLGGLKRSALARADREMLALHDELDKYPSGDDAPRQPAGGGQVHVPFILRHDGRVLSFLAIIATFGTAVDITLSELSIESFFPADATTAEYLRGRQGVMDVPGERG